MTDSQKAVFKIFIRGTIDAVWREITKTDEPQGAFFNMQLHTDGLAPGAKMQMRTANGKYTGMVGEILEFDPPHRYVHTLKFTQYDDPPCTVTYELEPAEGGVNFVMTCTDIPPGTKTAKDMTRGGTMIVKTLKAIVETGKPSVGTRLMYGMFKIMEPFSPKRTLTENWS